MDLVFPDNRDPRRFRRSVDEQPARSLGQGLADLCRVGYFRLQGVRLHGARVEDLGHHLGRLDLNPCSREADSLEEIRAL